MTMRHTLSFLLKLCKLAEVLLLAKTIMEIAFGPIPGTPIWLFITRLVHRLLEVASPMFRRSSNAKRLVALPTAFEKELKINHIRCTTKRRNDSMAVWGYTDLGVPLWEPTISAEFAPFWPRTSDHRRRT